MICAKKGWLRCGSRRELRKPLQLSSFCENQKSSLKVMVRQGKVRYIPSLFCHQHKAVLRATTQAPVSCKAKVLPVLTLEREKHSNYHEHSSARQALR